MRKFPPHRSVRAFTLVELLLSSGIVLIVGLIVASLLRSSLVLYVKNFSANDANIKGRTVSQKLSEVVQSAVQAPVLIDASGAVVAGNGPAPGVECVVPSSLNFYRSSSNTPVNGATMSTAVNATTLPAPNPGDYLMLQWYDNATSGSGSLFVQISSVGVAGNTATLTLAKTIQAAMIPPPLSTSVIKTGQVFQIMKRVSFVAIPSGNNTKMRYYSRARSVAVDGATAFNNPTNYREITDLSPLPSQTQCLPFSYASSDRLYLNVDIRSTSPRYRARSGSAANYFNSLRTQIASRSIIKTN